MLPNATPSGAIFSSCGRYRYSLWRRWRGGKKGILLIVGLNPSTADGTNDDATLRRCIGFAKREEFSTLIICNLFALRSTQPERLFTASDPVGPDNDKWLRHCCLQSNRTLVAWGATAERFVARTRRVLSLLDSDLWCLGTTTKSPTAAKRNHISQSSQPLQSESNPPTLSKASLRIKVFEPL